MRSTPLSEFTKHLELEVNGVEQLRFAPGQWLSIKATNHEGEEITRAYSIASPPSENGSFAVCLNRVESGFMSNYLCDLNEGDEITVQGPFGNFILHPPPRDTIFIATGTGVAPFRSMLQWLMVESARHQDRQYYLLFGSRQEDGLYYREEFKQMEGEHANFHFLPTLSRGPEEWPGLRGYVQDHVPGLIGDRSDMHAYICGLAKMVKMNRDYLKGRGWDRSAILYERYD